MTDGIDRDGFLADIAKQAFPPLMEEVGDAAAWEEVTDRREEDRGRERRPWVIVAGAAAVATAVIVATVWIASGLRPEPVADPVSTTTTTTIDVTPSSSSSTTSTEPTSTTTPVATSPVRGGSVVIGVDADLINGFTDVNGNFVEASINPLGPGAMFGTRDIGRMVVPGAYRFGVDGELTPWLVEDIPRLDNGGVVSDGGTVTVTYRIRQEAVWEDGTPVTAADFVFTYTTLADLRDSNPNAYMGYELIDASSMVADGKTLTFNLTRPDPSYERLFEFVLPSHIIDPATFLDDWNDGLWPSAGPFRFVSLERPGLPEPSIVVLERNPNYWEVDPETDEQLPYLDRVEVRAIAGGAVNPTEVAAQLDSGTLDATLRGVLQSGPGVNFDNLADAGLALVSESDTLFEVLAFNLRPDRLDTFPDSLNDQLAYRQSVLAAIDRDALGTATGLSPVDSIAGIAVDRYENDAWSGYDDPDRAVALLDDVDGLPIATYTSTSADETVRIGTAVVEQLQSAGIEASSDFTGDFYGTQLPEGLLDIYAFRIFAGLGGLSGVADALEVFDPAVEASFTLALWGELEEEATRYGEIVAAAQSELDQERLAELIAEAESLLADNALFYPMVRRQPSVRAYNPNRIRGIVPNRYQGWDTWNAATWWTPAEP